MWPAGSYELQAVYSGDANNNGATSACGTEPFTVTQASPTITTAPVPLLRGHRHARDRLGHLGRRHHQRRGDGDLHRLHQQHLCHPGVDQPDQRPAGGGDGDRRGGAPFGRR